MTVITCFFETPGGLSLRNLVPDARRVSSAGWPTVTRRLRCGIAGKWSLTMRNGARHAARHELNRVDQPTTMPDGQRENVDNQGAMPAPTNAATRVVPIAEAPSHPTSAAIIADAAGGRRFDRIETRTRFRTARIRTTDSATPAAIQANPTAGTPMTGSRQKENERREKEFPPASSAAPPRRPPQPTNIPPGQLRLGRRSSSEGTPAE